MVVDPFPKVRGALEAVRSFVLREFCNRCPDAFDGCVNCWACSVLGYICKALESERPMDAEVALEEAEALIIRAFCGGCRGDDAEDCQACDVYYALCDIWGAIAALKELRRQVA